MKLYDSIRKYSNSDPARFHMPGHKGTLCTYDITELGFSDNLHNPSGCIKTMQDACAAVYAADSAFLLVNGSSAGICAFCTALALKLGRGPRILVSRDCHKSFFSGAFFSDALICGIYPEDELCGTITPESIESTLENLSPKPDAIFITSPNYYGMCADTARIHKIAKSHGILLYVDAAHGAHFPFSPELPPIPDCDVFTVSTHKTLSAYNQTGLLLCNCDMHDELQSALDMLQTTSPSYPLMLSIEHGIDKAYEFEQHTERIKHFREILSDEGIKLANKPYSAHSQDITRICIYAEGLAANGYELEKNLRADGIFVEMADLYCAVLITAPCDMDEWYTRLLQSLLHQKAKSDCSAVAFTPLLHRAVGSYISVRSARLMPHKTIVLPDSANSVSTQALGVYPPGTAVVFPGEVISDAALQALLRCRSCGGELFGVLNGDEVSVIR